MSVLHPATGERVSLSIRTSMLSEYRNDAGRLRAFEVSSTFTSFGVLCSTLSKCYGVEFQGVSGLRWYPRPAKFTFRGLPFQVAIPFSDYWVGPLETGDAHSAMMELLDYVKHNVLRHRFALLRSNYITNY